MNKGCSKTSVSVVMVLIIGTENGNSTKKQVPGYDVDVILRVEAEPRDTVRCILIMNAL